MACKRDSELRLVLLGCAGAGKSSTANVILGTEDFREPETTKCEMSSRIVEGRNISVIDTPGMNNTSLTKEQWRTEIQRCAELSHPGPHVFLLVIRLWNFTKKDRKAVRWIREHFGKEALKFTVILFTGRENLSNRQWRKFSEDAQTLDIAMNSMQEVNPYQIKKLLQKVETVVQDNGGLYYPQEMFEVYQSKKITQETHEQERQKQESKKQMLKKILKAVYQKKQIRETTIKQEEINRGLTSGACAYMSSYKGDSQSLERLYTFMKLENEIEKDFKSIPFDLRQISENIEQLEETGATGGRLDSAITVSDHIGRILQEFGVCLWESVPVCLKQQQMIDKRDILSLAEHSLTHSGQGMRRNVIITFCSVFSTTTDFPTIQHMSDVRIVLLGCIGAGKSSSGNTILGRKAFGKEPSTDTIDAWRHDGVLENKTITVVDTDLLFEVICKHIVDDEVAPWLSDLMYQFYTLCNPGPHVFLAVVKTPGDSIDMISSIKRVFGSEFLKRTLILITHGDKCGTDAGTILKKTPDLQKFIDFHEVGCHVFNNKEIEDRTQVTELLEKIQVLVQKNEGEYYTTEMYWNRKKIEALVQNEKKHDTAGKKQKRKQVDQQESCSLL